MALQRKSNKRLKSHAKCTLWAWLVAISGATAILTVACLSIKFTAPGTATASKQVRFIPGYPASCASVTPISTKEWSVWSHLGPSHRIAVAAPALAIHKAAQKSLASGQRVWDSDRTPSQLSTLHAELNLSAILQHVGPYPVAAFKGRGVVVVGGGSKYTPPAFACVTFIRKTGCQLPIEVWAPPHEPVPAGVIPHFLALGAQVRNLGDVYDEEMHTALIRFVSKPAAILASSFKEVLLLDSDNIPLRNPDYLFYQGIYNASGLLTWPDFWKCEAKPAAWDAFGIPANMRPEGSHESGQLLIDKQRNWQPLLLALYLNLRGDVFYPMLSNVGQGDKETFPYAWLALAAAQHPSTLHYGHIPHGVLALGVWENRQHNGFAMLQRGPEGEPLFLHAHMPKVNLAAEGEFSRKWVNLTGVITLPPEVPKEYADNYRGLNAIAGYDIELAVHRLQHQLQCDRAWIECCL